MTPAYNKGPTVFGIVLLISPREIAIGTNITDMVRVHKVATHSLWHCTHDLCHGQAGHTEADLLRTLCHRTATW